ncbi:hypothetical protein FB567DRAFT_612923 [Paraphoma chrysanthemicola]|uniref:Uncharacterized protein n=1 Tax=Paraphoma chrysanthemicola TaxID=798071 RepID=A0A8K0VS55_9PLEO|nr:hypothetical protein FB567DRAFT_612923 [Paraphoma chrysanthemicola]
MMSSEAQRKRKSSHSPPQGQKRAKQSGTDPLLKETIDDELFGALSIDRNLRSKRRPWHKFSNDVNGRFVWVNWEGEGLKVAYKLGYRGKHVLVIACNPENTSSFVNEVEFMSEVKTPYAIRQNTISGSVTVPSWDEIHQTRDHVGNERFYRKYPLPQQQQCGNRSCPDTALTPNAAYVVCRNSPCRQAYHAACLSQGPLTFRRGRIESMNDRLLKCPACGVQFTSPVERPVTDGVLTVSLDIGTARSKAVATTSNSKRTQLLDSIGMPRPLVVTKGEHEIFFRPQINAKDTTIEPLKQLICSQKDPTPPWTATEILRRYFAKVVSVLRNQIPDSGTIRSIVLAVAVPAGITYEEKSVVLNAALGSCPESIAGIPVVPVMLNEAKMAYLAGGRTAHSSPESWRALACDIGGFSMDIVLLSVNPAHGSLDVQTKRSGSAYIGDGWLKSYIVDYIMHGATDGPLPEHFRLEVRSSVDHFFDSRYEKEHPVPEYVAAGSGNTHIQYGHVLEWREKEQIEKAEKCIKKLLDGVEGIDEVLITGGGTWDKNLLNAINKAFEPFLTPGVLPQVAPRPSLEQSTVLDGIEKHMTAQSCRQNKFSVFIDSFNNRDTNELIILQRRDEATENPVLPAARSLNTIFYEIEVGTDRNSSHNLRISVNDIPLSVNDRSYQVASVPNTGGLRLLDTITLDINDPIEKPKMLNLEVVEIHLHEGHGTAIVSALLLRPRTNDDTDWTSWGIHESMSVDEIGRMALRTDSRFHEIARMAKKVFPLDFESLDPAAEGSKVSRNASDPERVGPGESGGVLGRASDTTGDLAVAGPSTLGDVGWPVLGDGSNVAIAGSSTSGGVDEHRPDNGMGYERTVFEDWSGQDRVVFNAAGDLERVGPGGSGGVVGDEFDNASAIGSAEPSTFDSVDGYLFDDGGDSARPGPSPFGGKDGHRFDDGDDLKRVGPGEFGDTDGHWLDDGGDSGIPGLGEISGEGRIVSNDASDLRV